MPTLSLVLERTRTSDAPKGCRCLRLVGQGVTRLDVVEEHYRRVRKLFLSKNNLKELKHISQFANAETISLADNLISNLEEVMHLDSCTKLRNLNLSGNPLTTTPFYRYHCIRMLPQITSLDSYKITAQERELMSSAIDREASILSLMLSNYCATLKLKEACRRIR